MNLLLKFNWTLCVLFFVSLAMTACGGGNDDEPSATPSSSGALSTGPSNSGGGATAKGYVATKTLWNQKIIPVCWVNPEPANATARLWAQQAVERTWQAHSQLTFTGWATCPQRIAGDVVRILIKDDRSFSYLGTETLNQAYGMQLNLSFVQWGQASCQRSALTFQRCVEFTAVHEFGHAIGFEHEQDRPDTPADCPHSPSANTGVMVGPWDLYSVMNYCNPNQFTSHALSEIDVRMVQQFYGARSGLWAEYFNNSTLQGTPVFQRAERVFHNWAEGAPAPDMPSDQFSVRWSGSINAPVDGTYTLQTWSDDGIRVWVDGKLVIDNWTGHAITVDESAPLTWKAGPHAIRIEYQELSGMSTVALRWQVPGQFFDHVPLERLLPATVGFGLSAFYFDNPQLQGNPVLTRAEVVDFNWPGSPQDVPVAADGFSVRWSGMIEAPVSGSYVLQTLSDDGVRVTVDGELVIDNWTGHAQILDTSAPRQWEAGQRHLITVEYQELGGPGVAQLRWQTPDATEFVVVPAAQLYPLGRGTGLNGLYFQNADLAGDSLHQRTEALDFQWPAAPFDPIPADNFSAMWKGWIEAPVSGTYALQTLSDDGIRVWIDGRLVIDNWTGHAPVFDTSVELIWSAGERRAITVAYQELGGPGTLQLRWRPPQATAFSVVPRTHLYPRAQSTGLSAAYFANPNLQGSPAYHRTEVVNYQGETAPAPGVPADGFSVRWSGFIRGQGTGTHVLQTASDDGIRVWIDGQLVVDHWGGHAQMVDTSPALYWRPGELHAITIEYQELGGPGTAQLRWLTPFSGGYTAVPQFALSTH
ncbi:MAG: PA14 domain-containing protein [Pseudomonadota bacterium]